MHDVHDDPLNEGLGGGLYYPNNWANYYWIGFIKNERVIF